jgi:hypothetical protein
MNCKSAFWLSRPVLNWDDIYKWAGTAKVQKLMPPSELHMTLATVRKPVDWKDLEIHKDTIEIPAGFKKVEIFAFTIKALIFKNDRISARHQQLLSLYPEMDHTHFRPHVSLYKGGRMPKADYEGPLVLGPERIEEFDPDFQGVKHMKVSDFVF